MNHAGILSNCPGSVCLMAVYFLAAKVGLVCKRDAAKTRSPSSSPVRPSFLPQSSGDLSSGFSVMFSSLSPLWPLYKGSKCHHSPNQRTGRSDAIIDFIFCDQIIKHSSNAEVISLCVLLPFSLAQLRARSTKGQNLDHALTSTLRVTREDFGNYFILESQSKVTKQLGVAVVPAMPHIGTGVKETEVRSPAGKREGSQAERG